MNVSNELLRDIGGYSLAKGAWDSLQSISKNTTRLLILINQILRSYQNQGESAHSFVMRIKDLNRELSCIG